MIDFVKVITKQPITFLNNNLLDFNGTFKQNGGEILNKYEATYKSLKFQYFEQSEILLIKGSLHKYFNNGLHNYNDFDYKALSRVLIDIALKFNLCLNNCIIQNIEFGLNIRPPIKTNDLLDNLMIHKNEIFKTISLNKGYLKQVIHSQYIIKAYNKAMQYKLKDEVFRFEIKAIKMQKIKVLDIKTLEDLKSKKVLIAFFEVLLNEWSNILMFEPQPINKDIKPVLKTKKHYQYQSPTYWQNLSKQAKNRQKIIFNNYIENHTANNHKKIIDLLISKFNQLIK